MRRRGNFRKRRPRAAPDTLPRTAERYQMPGAPAYQPVRLALYWRTPSGWLLVAEEHSTLRGSGATQAEARAEFYRKLQGS